MSGQISRDKLDQIRFANDIVDVVGGYLQLKRAGANFTALCPFHREKTPSFNVNPRLQIYHCFGCHAGGDVFKFVQQYENVGFMDAVRRLADRVNIEIELDQSGEAREGREQREVLFSLHDKLARRWHQLLLSEPSAEVARSYLEGRGVGREAIETFKIGYALPSWEDTIQWASAAGFEPEILVRAGLAVRHEQRNSLYDRFRGRVMFPICDEQGRVIGFSGRLLDEEAKAAKYVNSPETPIFTKGRVLFGIDRSKRSLLEEKRAIVCEGQLDMISCFMAGVRNVVAPQGTALTSDQARILKRHVEEVVLCFDADEAGQNAAARSYESLAAYDLAVRVVQIPEGKDPDGYIREKGGESFQQLVQKAPEYFDFLLDRLGRTHQVNTDRGRIAVVQKLAEALAVTNNQVIWDSCSRKAAVLVGSSPEAIRSEMRKFAAGRHRVHQDEAGEVENEETEQVDPIEEWLLRILVLHPELVEWCVHHLDPAWLGHPMVSELVTHRFAHPEDEPVKLISQLPANSRQTYLSGLIARQLPIPDPKRQIQDVTIRLRNRYLDEEIRKLRMRSASSDTSEEDQIGLLRQIQDLISVRRHPLGPLPET